jgi:hypothetical protein
MITREFPGRFATFQLSADQGTHSCAGEAKKSTAAPTQAVSRGQALPSAMNALVFLYRRVLNFPMDGSINAVRASKKINVPAVLTREEVAVLISLLEGTSQC